MDLFQELGALIGKLQEAQIDYALCGGFAVAAHGIVRATEDIDLMVQEEAMGKLRAVVEPTGFWLQPEPLFFKEGKVKIYRFVKTQSGERDFVILDVLAVTPAVRAAWETRCSLKTDFGPVPVVSREGLIQLKTLRGSGQDLDDIEKLKER
ncbi:MAG: hypothetical protein C5B50_06280 [Verrucomicrobia bacterium]|nr:MAG: hypothetical protein C5B50_06280 [Verrucomicrobiota bacterium]